MAFAASALPLPLPLPLAADPRLAERRGLEPPPQHDVPLVAERPAGLGDLERERGHEARPGLVAGNGLEDRVEGEQRIPGEVHLGHEPGRPRRTEQREVDVRGAPRIVVVAPRIGARLHGDEAIPPLPVRPRPAFAGKVGVEGRIVAVAGMPVAPRRVRLPDLDEGIGNRAPALVDDPPAHHDSLSLGLTAGARVAGEVRVVAVRAGQPSGAGDLREGLADRDRRQARRAERGRAVGGVAVRGMGVRVARPVHVPFIHRRGRFGVGAGGHHARRPGGAVPRARPPGARPTDHPADRPPVLCAACPRLG